MGMLKLATIVLLCGTVSAAADGLPIKGAYGSKWSCATYAKSGADAVLNYTGESADNDQLILPNRLVEPGRSCEIRTEDGDLVAACTAKSTDGEILHYTNTAIFKRISKNEIFFGEVRFGTNYRRCP